jgi:hypothetical protein
MFPIRDSVQRDPLLSGTLLRDLQYRTLANVCVQTGGNTWPAKYILHDP